MTEIQKNTSIQQPDDEIDLIALAKTLWTGKKLIITATLVGMVLGLAVALLSPKEYIASTTIVPQLSDSKSKLGGLSSLAAMAGFNIDMNLQATELSPLIYPEIVQSVPFQLELMETSFTFKDVDHPVSLFEYFMNYSKPDVLSVVKKYTVGLPFLILGALKPEKQESAPAVSGNVLLENPIALTEDQEKIRKFLSEKINLDANEKQGYLVLSVISFDPNLAAQVAHKAQELLQKYITEFKIKKATAQLKFIEERYAEKKKDFENAQIKLAAFNDRNKNVTSAVARTEEVRLQNEYELAFQVYSQLAQQLEQAQIKVKEDTPVFSIVKPVTVPIEKSKPNRPMILVIWTFLGGILGVGWIFGKQFLKDIKAKWNEEQTVSE